MFLCVGGQQMLDRGYVRHLISINQKLIQFGFQTLQIK